MLPLREGPQARSSAAQQVKTELVLLGLTAVPEMISRWAWECGQGGPLTQEGTKSEVVMGRKSV